MASHFYEDNNTTGYGRKPQPKSILKQRDNITLPISSTFQSPSQENLPSAFPRRVSFANKVRLHKIDFVQVDKSESESAHSSAPNSDPDAPNGFPQDSSDEELEPAPPAQNPQNADSLDSSDDEKASEQEPTMNLTGHVTGSQEKTMELTHQLPPNPTNTLVHNSVVPYERELTMEMTNHHSNFQLQQQMGSHEEFSMDLTKLSYNPPQQFNFHPGSDNELTMDFTRFFMDNLPESQLTPIPVNSITNHTANSDGPAGNETSSMEFTEPFNRTTEGQFSIAQRQQQDADDSAASLPFVDSVSSPQKQDAFTKTDLLLVEERPDEESEVLMSQTILTENSHPVNSAQKESDKSSSPFQEAANLVPQAQGSNGETAENPDKSLQNGRDSILSENGNTSHHEQETQKTELPQQPVQQETAASQEQTPNNSESEIQLPVIQKRQSAEFQAEPNVPEESQKADLEKPSEAQAAEPAEPQQSEPADPQQIEELKSENQELTELQEAGEANEDIRNEQKDDSSQNNQDIEMQKPEQTPETSILEHPETRPESQEQNAKLLSLDEPVAFATPSNSPPATPPKNSENKEDEKTESERDPTEQFQPLTSSEIAENEPPVEENVLEPRPEDTSNRSLDLLFDSKEEDKENQVQESQQLQPSQAMVLTQSRSEVQEVADFGERKRKSDEDVGLKTKSPRIETRVSITDIPLAETSTLSAAEDDYDDPNYINVPLSKFLDDIDVRFYDDLEIASSTLRRYAPPPSTNEKKFTKEDYYRANIYLPLLEVHDLSCKELAGKIQQGKTLYDEISARTEKDNPLLFRKFYKQNYYDQITTKSKFHHLKDLTRQQAKEVWYGWRIQLMQNVLDVVQGSLEILELDRVNILENISMLETTHEEYTRTLAEKKKDVERFREIKQSYQNLDSEQLMQIKTELMDLNAQLIDHRKKIDEESDRLEQKRKAIQQKTEEANEVKARIAEMENSLSKTKFFNEKEIKTLEKRLEELQKTVGLEIVEDKADVIVCELDGSIRVEIGVENETVPSKINIAVIEEPTRSKLHFPQLAKIFISPQTTAGNVVQRLHDFKQLWKQVVQIDKDIYWLSLKWPVEIEHINDKLLVHVLHYNEEADCEVRYELEVEAEAEKYPSLISASAEVKRGSPALWLKHKTNNALLNSIGEISLST